MTVDELARLASYPPGLRVVVNGYEDGYDDQWEGKHGDPNGLTGSASDDAEVVEAPVLSRVSN